MLDTIGLIMACDNQTELGELTKVRTACAVPFAGRYRLVDFVLSAMVNSEIDTVGLATDHKFQSLLNHLGNGKPWDLARKRGGLLIIPPYSPEVDLSRDARISLLISALGYLRRCKQNYVVVADSNNVCNIRFDDIVQQHIARGADITVVYQSEKEKTERDSYLDCDENEKVVDVVYKNDRKKCTNRIVGYYVFNKQVLIDIVEQCRLHDKKSFIKDVIESNIKRYKIYGWCFDGYLRTVYDIDSLYQASMDLLDNNCRKQLFLSEYRILTKSKDRVPTRYLANAEVKCSLVADGCVIDGVVENSIISRGVSVEKGAVVKNSIIMPDCTISANATLSAVILDKNCNIRQGKTLVGQPDFPIVVGKHRTI